MKVSYLQASLLTLALFVAPGPVKVLAEDVPPLVLAQEGQLPDIGQSQQDCDPQDESCPPQKQKRKKKKGEDKQDQSQQQPAQDIQQDEPSNSGEQPPQQKQKKKKKKQNDVDQVTEPEQKVAPEPAAPRAVEQQPQDEAAPPPTPPKPPRKKQGDVEQSAQPDQPAAPVPVAPAGNDKVAAFLKSVRPASELSAEALRQQMRQAQELSSAENLSAGQREGLRNVIRDARVALRSKADGENGQASGGQAAPEDGQPAQRTQEQEQGQGQASRVDPALERQAQAILNDQVNVDTMQRRELRQRLSGMRDLLASGKLSPQTADALRQKLARERQVLRNEVAVEERGNPPPPRPGQEGSQDRRPPRDKDKQRGSNGSNGPDIDITVVLGDRRPPNDLEDDELVRRIDTYRDVVGDDRYSDEERQRWRWQMERDRRFLRERMLEERRYREERLRSGDIEYDIDVEDEYIPDRRVPPSVFAAEVEDDELADVLVAPPRRKIERRYTVDEIERSPQARDAMARIEIDTVHFGFGEGFLREEEIDKLDRIAVILEKILAKHPEEVFLLEGHTDAVGSDAANLQLSRQRAAAVKQALVTYYVIPAENLKTVGLGERYLKIPTLQPEAENRRVSLARITPLVGQAE